MPGGYTDTGLTLEGFLFLQVRGKGEGRGEKRLSCGRRTPLFAHAHLDGRAADYRNVTARAQEAGVVRVSKQGPSQCSSHAHKLLECRVIPERRVAAAGMCVGCKGRDCRWKYMCNTLLNTWLLPPGTRASSSSGGGLKQSGRCSAALVSAQRGKRDTVTYYTYSNAGIKHGARRTPVCGSAPANVPFARGHMASKCTVTMPLPARMRSIPCAFQATTTTCG